MFLDCPLRSASDRHYDEIDRLAERRCVVVAEAVLDQHQGTIVRQGATAGAQNRRRFRVVLVMNDVLHHVGARI